MKCFDKIRQSADTDYYPLNFVNIEVQVLCIPCHLRLVAGTYHFFDMSYAIEFIADHGTLRMQQRFFNDRIPDVCVLRHSNNVLQQLYAVRLLTLLTVAMLLLALAMAGCMCGAQWTQTCALCSPAARRPGRYPRSLGRLHKGRLWLLTSRADALFGSSSLTHSLSNSLSHSLTYTLTHSLTHSLTLTHLLT